MLESSECKFSLDIEIHRIIVLQHTAMLEILSFSNLDVHGIRSKDRRPQDLLRMDVLRICVLRIIYLQDNNVQE